MVKIYRNHYRKSKKAVKTAKKKYNSRQDKLFDKYHKNTGRYPIYRGKYTKHFNEWLIKQL